MTAFNFEWKYEKLAVVVHVDVDDAELSLHVADLQRTAKKCAKIYKARAQLLFYSLNRLFGDVFVVVVVVVCLSSLINSTILHTTAATTYYFLSV